MCMLWSTCMLILFLKFKQMRTRERLVCPNFGRNSAKKKSTSVYAMVNIYVDTISKFQTDADQRETGLSKFWQKFGQKKVHICVCYDALRKNLKLTPLAGARFARIKYLRTFRSFSLKYFHF